MMIRSLAVGGLTLPIAYVVAAAADDGTSTFGNITHYPPVNNTIGDLQAVFDPATGTNGGFYNTSHVSDDEYGAYNFCNMPHTRKQEYKKPEGYDLFYVELTHRHHKRTPYASNCFPVEDIPLYCDDITDFYYAQNDNSGSFDAVEIGWANYQDPLNPLTFVNQGFNGTCQFPQISNPGLNDSYVHGLDLKGVYGDMLEFLPKEYDPALVKYRVTSNAITSQVAGAVIKAMYEDEVSIDVYQQGSSIDSLTPSYSCGFASDVRNAYQSVPAWQEHLNMSQDLFAQLDAISGVNPKDSGWHSWFDHYFDNLAFRECHQLSLPCNVSNSSDCITQEMAEQVFRLGDYEYNYIFRQAENSTLYSAAEYGIWLYELRSHMADRIAGTDSTIYRHNIAHDGSISPLLGAFQINFLRWPGMGAEVLFELWRKQQSNDYFVRVLYGGVPLETTGPLGTIDMIPLDQFTDYIDTLVGPAASYTVELCSIEEEDDE